MTETASAYLVNAGIFLVSGALVGFALGVLLGNAADNPTPRTMRQAPVVFWLEVLSIAAAGVSLAEESAEGVLLAFALVWVALIIDQSNKRDAYRQLQRAMAQATRSAEAAVARILQDVH